MLILCNNHLRLCNTFTYQIVFFNEKSDYYLCFLEISRGYIKVNSKDVHLWNNKYNHQKEYTMYK